MTIDSLKLFLLILLLALIAGPASAGTGSDPDELGPGDFCDGDPYHYHHQVPIDTTGCQAAINPHFPDWTQEADCRDSNQARNCQGCYGCCNGKADEKKGCHCNVLSGTVGRICDRTIERLRSDCQSQCGIPFNDCNTADPTYKFPSH